MFRSFLTLSTGEGVGRILHVLAFMLLARTFGKDALGHFGLMVVVSTYLLLFVQQGFDTIATREVARSPKEVRRYAQAIIGLRLLLAAAVFLPVVLYAFWRGPMQIANSLLLVFSLRLFVTAATPQWSFFALEKPRVVAVGSIISQLTFLLGVILLQDPSKIVWVACAQVFGELLTAVYLWFSLKKETGRLHPVADWELWRRLVYDALPISASLLLGNLLYNFDVMALGWFSSAAQIGLYLACYRCVTVFTPFFTMLYASSFPSFSRAYPDGPRLWGLGRRVAVPAMVVAFVTAAFLSWGAERILTLLYGKPFAEGTRILQILVWVLPIQAGRGVLRQMLLAFHLQKLETRLMAVSVGTNICLDLVLAPLLGAAGCAISTVISELVMVAMAARWVSRHVGKTHIEPNPVPPMVNQVVLRMRLP